MVGTGAGMSNFLNDKLRPLGEAVEQLERSTDAAVREFYRTRFAAIFAAAGATKTGCTCHPLRLDARQVLFDVNGHPFDAEGAPHTCNPTHPANEGAPTRARPIKRRPIT